MGCLTGCYLLVKTAHEIQPREIAPLVRRAFRHMAGYEGDVPGATPVNCGNYLLHDLPMARWEADAFLGRSWKYTYPKAERVKAGGRVFFDA